jgi:tetratricopeptide (TPR) repeat protein
MFKRVRLSLIVILVTLLLAALWYAWRPAATPAPVAPQQGYSNALSQARNGQPGAARVLYQQLARSDLSAERRAALYAQLPNYPSPQALKLATADLHNDVSEVRHAAIDAVIGLVPESQRSVLLGPLLEDRDEAIRFHAVRGLLGLPADELGLYFAHLDKAVNAYITALQGQTDDAAAQLELARLYLHDAAHDQAEQALARYRLLEPDDLDAIAVQVELLERQGKSDQARRLLAEQLLAHPQSALLQQQLGLWLMAHDEDEYALLALARAVELAPDNNDYRYVLATNLHDLQQVEAAQKQLEEILRRDPANRRARVLLIQYWKETGQLQNVQVLLAELEQQNADDPSLQQGL